MRAQADEVIEHEQEQEQGGLADMEVDGEDFLREREEDDLFMSDGLDPDNEFDEVMEGEVDDDDVAVGERGSTSTTVKKSNGKLAKLEKKY